jgi:hypothetical protein
VVIFTGFQTAERLTGRGADWQGGERLGLARRGKDIDDLTKANGRALRGGARRG